MRYGFFHLIDEELIGSIETENKKEVDDYKNVTTQLLNSMQEYDGKVTAFNPSISIDIFSVSSSSSDGISVFCVLSNDSSVPLSSSVLS